VKISVAILDLLSYKIIILWRMTVDKWQKYHDQNLRRFKLTLAIGIL